MRVFTILLLSPLLSASSLSTDTTLCTTDNIGSLLPHTSDCSQYYYCSPDTQAILSNCPSEHFFDTSSNRCVPNYGATCDNFVFNTSDICPPTPTCTIYDLLQTKPYPTDCKKYIYCSITGKVRVLSCLLGYHFSPITNSCQRISEAQCPYCIETPLTTPAPNTTPNFPTTPPPICEDIPTCSAEEIGVLKPFPSNCSLLVYCSGENEFSVRFCPNDFEFSSTEGICLPPSEAKCPKCIETTTTPITPTCPPITVCTIDDIWHMKPYPADCNRYVFCTGEDEFEVRYCHIGLEFSSSEEMCLPASQANCSKCIETITTTPAPPTCPPITSCTIADAGFLKPYPPDCTMYLYCDIEGITHCSKCPKSRPYFNSKLNYCTSVEEALCESCGVPNINTIDCTIPVCDAVQQCTNFGDVLPYPQNCIKYVYCDGSEDGIVRLCATGEHFSPSKNECVSLEESDCQFCVTGLISYQ